jgi:predicted lipoprotein
VISAAPALAFDHAAAARRALEQHILPGYRSFAGAAQSLADRAAALCRSPSTSALAETRDAARAALLAFGRIEHIRFGPITEEQRLDRLLFYPDPRGVAHRQIARLLSRQNDAELAPDRLARASVAVQGFTALDYALFGEGSDALAAPGADFRCRYVAALAAGVARIAADTLADWSGGYRTAWLKPGASDKSYLSAEETTQALLRAYVTGLEVVLMQRLIPVLDGDGKGGPRAPPIFAYSGQGLPFVLANIEGVRDLLTATGFTDASLAADARERGDMSVLESVVTDLGFALHAGERALTAAPDPFASGNARKELGPMVFSLKNATETGRSALSALTGLSVGFNSLDGD